MNRLILTFALALLASTAVAAQAQDDASQRAETPYWWIRYCNHENVDCRLRGGSFEECEKEWRVCYFGWGYLIGLAGQLAE